jgi:hypothetical protein
MVVGDNGVLKVDGASLLFDDLKILDELTDLEAEVNTFDSIHAFISIFFFKMGSQFMAALFEFHDVGILFLVKIKADRDAVFCNIRIHLHDLVF